MNEETPTAIENIDPTEVLKDIRETLTTLAGKYRLTNSGDYHHICDQLDILEKHHQRETQQ